MKWSALFGALGIGLLVMADPIHPIFFILAGYFSLVLALAFFMASETIRDWIDRDDARRGHPSNPDRWMR